MRRPRTAGRRGSSNRGGFALVKLLIVVMLMGILARIALPAYQGLLLQAGAAQALGDVNAVRLAAFSYNDETGRWPRDASRGIVPPELEPYLNAGFSFDREGYRLDWDNWTLPDGAPSHPGTNVLLGISVATQDTALGQALLELVGDAIVRYTINEHYTFILAAQ